MHLSVIPGIVLTIGDSLTGTMQTAAPGGQLTSLIGLRGSQMLMQKSGEASVVSSSSTNAS